MLCRCNKLSDMILIDPAVTKNVLEPLYRTGVVQDTFINSTHINIKLTHSTIEALPYQIITLSSGVCISKDVIKIQHNVEHSFAD